MLDVHAAAVSTAGSIYHEFLLRYKKNDQVVYGIVEGKDDPVFYQGLIEQYLPAEWNVQLIKSGNRANVLSTLADFNWKRFSNKRICFFIDRDLSIFRATQDPISANLYITDKYSIENEAASFNTVSRLLHDVLNVTEASVQEIEILKEKFYENLQNFCEWFTPVMAQIVAWQRAGLRPALDNIFPKEMFAFSSGILTLKTGFELPEDRVKYAARKVGCDVSSREILDAVEKEFREKGGKERFIRGKYILWFVIEATLEIHREITLFCKAYSAAPKVKLTMGHANAMALVGTRIRCPQSLVEFVKKGYLEYISPSRIEEVSVEKPDQSRSFLSQCKELLRVFFKR
jgi:hypothetical protein